MLEFCLAVFLMLITPGPGVLSTAGVGAAFGARSGVAYVTGLFLGSNLVMLAVITGLAALILASPTIRLILLIASTAYLLYLAVRIAFSGSKVAFITAQSRPGIRTGIALQIINPKAYVVGNTFFAGFPWWADAYWTEAAVKLVLLNAIWIPIHIAWLYAGVALERLNLPHRTQRGINIAMAVAMLGVVALAARSGLG